MHAETAHFWPKRCLGASWRNFLLETVALRSRVLRSVTKHVRSPKSRALVHAETAHFWPKRCLGSSWRNFLLETTALRSLRHRSVAKPRKSSNLHRIKTSWRQPHVACLRTHRFHSPALRRLETTTHKNQKNTKNKKMQKKTFFLRNIRKCVHSPGKVMFFELKLFNFKNFKRSSRRLADFWASGSPFLVGL